MSKASQLVRNGTVARGRSIRALDQGEATRQAAPSDMLAVGDILQGRYRIVREIGAGGMGTVYEGENLRIRRRVAIKVMRAADEPSTELLARFEREAQIASQIPSDHITEVLDLGELDNGQLFIVMEYLEGQSLAARLDRVGRLQPRELVGLMRQLLVALSAAHRAGVIHRDIKPDNIFILDEKAGLSDFIKLLDFGVSKLHRPGSESHLTQRGAVVGTPSYMSPEQVSGAEPSPLWDLYSVGVIAYRALTGEVPFKSLQLDELVYKVALGRFVPPIERVTGLDPELNSIVCRAMARLPEQRFQDADHFIAALDAWLEHTGEFLLSPAPGSRPPGLLTSRSATPRSAPPRSGPPASGTPHTATPHSATQRHSSMPTPPIPLGGAAESASAHPGSGAFGPTTHLTTELASERTRRQTLRRRWGAASVTIAVLGAATAFMLWRARQTPESLLSEQSFSAQPALPAAEPLPDPLPAGAPRAAGATANLPGNTLAAPAAAGRAAEGNEDLSRSSSKQDKRQRARAAKRERRAKAETRAASTRAAPAEVAAPPNAADPAEPAQERAKARPDWGY
jgi:eukaryotic-like serine/threonine-protein kinase